MNPFTPEVVEIQRGIKQSMSIASLAIDMRPNPKPRVRWIRSKYFGCWQWSTDNASGLSNGIRTEQDEDNFYSDRFVAKWTQ